MSNQQNFQSLVVKASVLLNCYPCNNDRLRHNLYVSFILQLFELYWFAREIQYPLSRAKPTLVGNDWDSIDLRHFQVFSLVNTWCFSPRWRLELFGQHCYLLCFLHGKKLTAHVKRWHLFKPGILSEQLQRIWRSKDLTWRVHIWS